MNNNKITTRQLTWLYAIAIKGMFIGSALTANLMFTGNDFIIALLIAFAITIIFAVLMMKIVNYQPELMIFQKVRHLFGFWGGLIVNSIIIALFALMLYQTFYTFVDFVAIKYLLRTPIWIIGLVGLVTVCYAVNAGMEAIVRFAPIAFFFTILAFLFLVFCSGSLDTRNYFPLFISTSNNIFNSVLHLLSLMLLPLFTLTLIPKNGLVKPEEYYKGMTAALIIAFVLAFLELFSIIGFLGVERALIYKHPEYYVLKKVYLFSFFQNVENVLSIRWLLETFIILVLAIKMIKNGIVTSLNLRKEKIIKAIPYLCSLIILIIMINTHGYKFIPLDIYLDYYGMLIVYPLFAIMLLLLVSIFIRKRMLKVKKN